MTSMSPPTVHYLHRASILDYGDTLNVTSARVTIDTDGTRYATATFVCEAVSNLTWSRLDPREGARVRWNIKQQYVDTFGILRTFSALPFASWTTDDQWAVMWVRHVERDMLAGTVTIDLSTGEAMLEDKLRIAGTTLNTGATTVEGLVRYSLGDVFGTYTFSDDAYTAGTSIPAGERRLMMQGESHADLIQPELDALNVRVVDAFGTIWRTLDRSVMYGDVMQLASFRGDILTGYDSIVTGLVLTVSREDEWADGVLVEYRQPGTPTSVFQASGAGVNTRGRVIQRDRNPPAGNAAESIVQRSVLRGYDAEITARIRFDFPLADTAECIPSYITVMTRGETDDTGYAPVVFCRTRSIEWDTSTGLMTILAQTSDPLV